jgi:hypothetical protein
MALLGAGCTRCGQPYAAQGIRVLAQREEIAFVQLVCFACQTQTLALVTGAPASEGDPDGRGRDVRGDLPQDEGGLGTYTSHGTGRAISESDVLDMRSYLADYQGDLRSLVNRSPDERRPGAEADGDEAGRAE